MTLEAERSPIRKIEHEIGAQRDRFDMVSLKPLCGTALNAPILVAHLHAASPA